MKRRKGKSARILTFPTLVGLLLLIIGIIVLSQSQGEVIKQPYSSYFQVTDLVMKVYLKNNSLYGNDSNLSDPVIIFPSITKNVSLTATFIYYYPGLNKTNVSIKTKAILSSSTPKWNKITYVNSFRELVPCNSNMTFDIPINISANLTTGNSIDQELGQLYVTPFLLNITFSTTSILGTTYSNMSMVLSNYYTVSSFSPGKISNDLYKLVRTSADAIIPIPKVYGILITVFAVLFLLPVTINYLPQQEKKTYSSRFKKDHADILVELKQPPSGTMIAVSNPDQILKLASFIDRPVLLFGDQIFVEMDGKVYSADLEESK